LTLDSWLPSNSIFNTQSYDQVQRIAFQTCFQNVKFPIGYVSHDGK